MIAVFVASISLGGCAWLDALQETDSEPDFPQWTKVMAGTPRQTEEKKSAPAVKSKSLFFDKRSQEVEKSIGWEE